MLSNRQIDKLGEKLKQEEKLSKDENQGLLEWRNSFSPTLDYYHKRIKAKVVNEDIVAIAKRIKRIESIKMKLKRYPSMRLSTLQDVAGLRVVLQNKGKLEKAFTKIRNSESVNKLKRLDDYHHTPKNDGYRGIHLIYQKTNSRMIEIQLRTELEHIWATAVEVYGTLQKESFKTGEGNEDWKNFFKTLSSYFAIIENCLPSKEHEKLSKKKILSRLKKSIRNLNVIEKLNTVSNSIEVVINKRNKGRPGRYALLELDYKNGITSIDIFTKKEIHIAIEEYTKKELSMKKDDGKNIVFVNIESVENLKMAYPNYFLDTKKLLHILSDIVLNN